MRKKRKKGCLPFVVTIVIILALFAAFVYMKTMYTNTLERIEKQISDLPKFDEQAIAKDIASKMNLPYPVPKPNKKQDEIERLAKSQAKALTDTKYSQRKLAIEVGAILKKWRCVRRGEPVKFLMNTTRQFVTGTFQGILLERKDKFIKVDFVKYLYNDISSDFYYLFNPDLSARMAAAKIKEAKQKYKRHRTDFYAQTLARIKPALYETNGYIEKNGTWTSHHAIVVNLTSDEKLNYKREILKKTAAIIEKNQFLGFIPLTPENKKKPLAVEKSEDVQATQE